MRAHLLGLVVPLGFSLACMGAPGAPGGAADGYGDVIYKRYKNMNEAEILEFSSTEKVQIFYSGRFDQRTTRVGTWSQDGTEIDLDLEPLKDFDKPHSVHIDLKQLGKCSLALYHRDKTDGSVWASGDFQEDGENLEQPVIFEQKWPPCETH